MDKQKIAFITCVNDEIEYAECRFYLEQLKVPEGYSIDVISIREAQSMTAGYNAGMRDSDAKYKVYLHQDVFIKNKNFIENILKIFSENEDIGIMGMVGKRNIGATAAGMQKWDIGKVVFDNVIMNWDVSMKECFEEVAIVDGLLLATQYDIPWREDIFDGWDFYDFSQCMEFRKSGYKVAVPWQEEIWCCHDGTSSILTEYYEYYNRFLDEYAELADICSEEMNTRQYMDENKIAVQQINEFRKKLEYLLDIGEREALRDLFKDPDFRRIPNLREYETIACIDQIEEDNQSNIRFWCDGMSASDLMSKLRMLKFILKRIEYEMEEWEAADIWKNYSEYAVIEVCKRHITCEEKVYRKLAGNLMG